MSEREKKKRVDEETRKRNEVSEIKERRKEKVEREGGKG